MHRWLVVMLLFSGCAFGLSGPDPDRPRSQVPKCDTGKGLVVLDGAMAVTSGVIAMSVAGETEPAIALLPLSIGALYMAGAINGNSKVNKCRKAMGEYENYMVAHEALPEGGASRDKDGEEDEEDRPPKLPMLPAQEPASQTITPAAPTTLATRQPALPLPAPQQQPPPAAPVQPAPAAPAQAGPPTPAKAKAPPKREPDDDWTDFWREVEP
jgi:hypothetical protein